MQKRTNWPHKLFDALKRAYRPMLVVLAISLFFSGISLRLIRNESLRNIKKTSEYFLQNINSQLTNLVAFSHDLLNQQTAIEAGTLYQTDADLQTIFRASARVGRYIYSFCSANPMVEDVVFYYPDSDMFINRTGYLSMEAYFALSNPDAVWDEEQVRQWFTDCFCHEQNGFFPVKRLDGGLDIYFYRSSPDNTSTQLANRVILLKINQATVTELMQRLAALMNQQLVAMVTPDGQVYAMTGELADDDAAKTIQQLQSSGYFTQQVHSDVWGMDLYFAQGLSEVESFTGTMVKVLIGGVVLAFVLGLASSVAQYAAMAHRAASVLNKLGFASGDDVYAVISEKLNHFYNENLQNIRIIESQRLLLIDACLKSLLHTAERSSEEEEAVCATFDVNFENDFFCCFVVAYDTSLRPPLHQDDVMTQLLSEFEREAFFVCCCRLELADILICNYDATPQGKQLLAAFSGRLRGCGFGTICGNGRALPNLRSALDECRAVYRVATGKSLQYGKQSEFSNLISGFLAALQRADTASARAMIPSVYAHTTAEGGGNAMLCLRYSVLSGLYALPQFRSSSAVPDQIYANLSAQNWLLPLEQWLDAQQSQADAKPVIHRNVIAQAEHIISTEYVNRNMSLSSLADRLGVSQSYLSRAFKQTYGVNISYYLNKTRIENAKKQMLSSDCNLNTIALNVGFLSDMNFIRVFKKMENETPGAYRRRAASDEDADLRGDDTPGEPA